MLINSPKDLAVKVKNWRKSSNLSQAQLADMVGLRQATVSEFETDPESTKLETLFRILSAVNLELHVIEKDAFTREGKETWGEAW